MYNFTNFNGATPIKFDNIKKSLVLPIHQNNLSLCKSAV